MERESSSDKIEERMSVDCSFQQNLFDDHQAQELLSARDSMDAQNEVSEPTMYESYAYEKRPDFGYCTGAEKPVENQVSDGDD